MTRKARNEKHSLTSTVESRIISCLEKLSQPSHRCITTAQILERLSNNYRNERLEQIKESPQLARLVIVSDNNLQKTDNNKQSGNKGPEKLAKATRLIIPSRKQDIARWILEQVKNNPTDCVILDGVSMQLVLTGILYKLAWRAVVLVKQEEKYNSGLPRPLGINELKKKIINLPDSNTMKGSHWLQLALDLASRFDHKIREKKYVEWQSFLKENRQKIDAAQLNTLELILPHEASPLMAARFWNWSNNRIQWDELEHKKRDPDLCSIIIPVYGESNELDNCLQSIRTSDEKLKWEVVAVMNEESAENKRVVTKHIREDWRINAIWPGENTQFALGCNIGFAACEGQRIVFLNNDCRVRSKWLDGLLTPLDNHKVAATQPRLLKENGEIQSLGVVFTTNQAQGYPLHRGISGELPYTKKTQELQALTGACLAVRADDFAKVRGFDCRYINSQEDIDLCLRLLQLPERKFCLSIGTIDVLHRESKAPGRFNHIKWSRHQFVRRWSMRINKDDTSIYQHDKLNPLQFARDEQDFDMERI